MSDHADRVLVPVARSRTLRATVDYAVETALDSAGPSSPATIRFVYVHPLEIIDETGQVTDESTAATDLLHRVSVWAEETAGDRADELVIEEAELGGDEYLFSPSDIADVLLETTREAGFDRIVIDPEYDPGVGAPLLRPLKFELTQADVVTIDEAPVRRGIRRPPIFRRTTPIRVGMLFGISFLFYQLLAGGFELFDIVTGGITATLVAVALSRISFREPTRSSPVKLLRMLVYVPYLLYEITKANIQVALVILHPNLPIDPRMTRFESAVWGSLPVTTLANSITLTPGTLTVRVDGRNLLVHTLVPAARDGLFNGGLERAVRFVFYGRKAIRIASPRDRNEAAVLDPEVSVEAPVPEPNDSNRDDP